MTPEDHKANKELSEKAPTPKEFTDKAKIEREKKRERLVGTWTEYFKTELHEKEKREDYTPELKLHVVNCLSEHDLNILMEHFAGFGWKMYYSPESDTSWQMTAKSYHTFTKHYYAFRPIEK